MVSILLAIFTGTVVARFNTFNDEKLALSFNFLSSGMIPTFLFLFFKLNDLKTKNMWNLAIEIIRDIARFN